MVTQKNWLITGGCGFIGTSLIQQLLKIDRTTNIRVLDNLSVGNEEDLSEVAKFNKIANPTGAPEGIELFVGDIKNTEDCLNACKGIDIIVHLAANTGVGPSVEDPEADMQANVIGIFNVLQAARANKTNKFIFASSGAPIGELNNPPIHEELPAHPVSPYGASKLAGEGYCSAYFHSFGINTVALRFGNVYGPRSKHKASVVAKFIKQALNGETCEIYGTGQQTRDFIYILDLVDAIIKSAQADVGGEVFQIASSKERTVNEIVEIVQQELKKYGIELKLEYGETRVGDVMRNFSDVSKANAMLGWHATTNISDGIAKTIGDFVTECPINVKNDKIELVNTWNQ
ncbi:MAG: GDP-mannose 4,6-dehydratase [Xanthomonadales bacterium]|nr:GDP-mannose 4,6-dehydratase [Xanthomonadales bacterium]